VRDGTAGGWASLHARRLYGLLMLNAVGIHGFDGLQVIEFNKPAALWDGTETLSYSYRLNHKQTQFVARMKRSAIREGVLRCDAAAPDFIRATTSVAVDRRSRRGIHSSELRASDSAFQSAIP